MKRSFTSLRRSLSASRIIYLSFQDSKSVVFDRRANQAFQTDGKQEAYSLWEMTQHSNTPTAEGRIRQKVPSKETQKTQLNTN